MQSLGIKQLRFSSFSAYVLPSIIMMIFMSFYTIVDGAFVSMFVGEEALAGTNIVYPLNNLVLGIGIMFATGSNAVVSMLLGEGNEQQAKEKFSLSIWTALVIGIVIAIVMLIFFRPILMLLGAEGTVYRYSFEYGIVLVIGAPLTILKEILVSYLRVDGQPKLSLFATILGGVLNIVLDYLFVKVFGWGVLGAAVATGIGIAAGMGVALWYFLSGKSLLRFCRFRMDWKVIFKIMGNGSSEMVNQVSAGITTLLFNLIALKFYGAMGVASVTIMMYAEFVFISLFLGLGMGSAPLISYYYGAQNYGANRKILRYVAALLGISSVFLFVFAHFFPQAIVGMFTLSQSEVYHLANHGLSLFSFSLIFSGINLFVSGMFTAYGNGAISALIAFSRSTVFLVGCLLLLPEWIGFDGVWLAVPVTEAMTFVIVAVCFFCYRNRYHLTAGSKK